ncbi:MAG: hypothetical protein PUI38_02980 [Candidatus Treponema excrementipullorum]|nr:hypothetical protein [Candidatus Treponema excrementipullorum]MDY4708108.1 hypothetical protein [Candidatus Treponema excrementipullorum]
MNIILGIIAVVSLLDLLFLFFHILGEGAAGIVSWICYPLFGLVPVSLIMGVFIRILEGGMVFFFLGRFFS